MLEITFRITFSSIAQVGNDDVWVDRFNILNPGSVAIKASRLSVDKFIWLSSWESLDPSTTRTNSFGTCKAAKFISSKTLLEGETKAL
jgi:hypothetical protein